MARTMSYYATYQQEVHGTEVHGIAKKITDTMYMFDQEGAAYAQMISGDDCSNLLLAGRVDIVTQQSSASMIKDICGY